jgi:hypothetical protein
MDENICYNSRMRLLYKTTVFWALWFPIFAFAQQNLNEGGIILLEPIGDTDEINASPGLGALGHYLSLLYPWLVGMGAATAVLMAVVGGIQIIQAGADTGKRDAGKNRLLMSLGGLLIVMLSATILNALNPSFFQ